MSREPADVVSVQTTSGITTIVLQSRANRNSLSARVAAELLAALNGVRADPQVHCVVLTHQGTTFCSGIDLVEAREDAAAGPRNLLAVLTAVVELPVPVVALVDGHVRAGGMGLVGACDIAVAGPSATFSFTEVKLGLAPVVIGLVLESVLDPRATTLYQLSGEVFDAHVAQTIGLVTSASPEPVPEVDAFTRTLCRSPRQGLTETKRLATRVTRAALSTRGAQAVELSASLFASPVARESLDAFARSRSHVPTAVTTA